MRRSLLAALLLALVALPLMAQETETEKQAATTVVKQVHDLEQSLNVDQMVAKLTAPDPGREEVLARVKQLMQTELLPMADAITRDPEIGFQENPCRRKAYSLLASA